jgi:hypothetical protein
VTAEERRAIRARAERVLFDAWLDNQEVRRRAKRAPRALTANAKPGVSYRGSWNWGEGATRVHVG